MRAESTTEKDAARPSPVQALRDYVKEVRVEMSKVSWPTREELRQHTIVTVVMVFIVAVIIGIIDRGLTLGFEAVLRLVRP